MPETEPTENKVLQAALNEVDGTIDRFCRILYGVYNLVILSMTDSGAYNEKLGGESLHTYVKNKYGLDDYYANSIVNLAKGRVDLQIKLNREYQKQKECSLKEIREKLKDTGTKLKDFKKLRNDFIQYRNNGCGGKLKIKGIKNISIKDGHIEVRYMRKGEICTDTYNPYSFEYEYLNRKINHLKNLAGKYKYRMHILEDKVRNLDDIKYAIFGTRKLMREYNRCDSPEDKARLKEMIRQKKYKSFSISGRKDAKTGNFVFKPRYNESKGTFDIRVRMIDGESVEFKDVRFPYRKEDFLKALSTKMPICFSIVRKVKDKRVYYLISATFDLEKVKRINCDISTGVVGMDFNYGHIDVAETDGKGNMVNRFTVWYDTDRGKHENEQSLRKALTNVAEYASGKHKIMVVEELDLETAKYKANRDKPKNRRLNQILHNFPYQRYNEIVRQLGMKHELLVREVKPAFTSIIAKHKYADAMKLGVHMAAGYVIARRGMGFHERLLPEQRKIVAEHGYGNKSEWAKWSYIRKLADKQEREKAKEKTC